MSLTVDFLREVGLTRNFVKSSFTELNQLSLVFLFALFPSELE